MPQPLLWVQHNTLDGTSRNLLKKDKALVRSHVQCHRPKEDEVCKASGSTRSLDQTNQQQINCIPNVLRQSLQPNKSLGRLALSKKPARSTPKRQKLRDGTAKAPSLKLTTDSNAAPALSRNLPWLWPDLHSGERRSLAFFELRTSQEWSGWEDTYFWNVLALQVSQQSQIVARSLIALSCLHEQMETVGCVRRTQLQDVSSEQSAKATNVLVARSEMSYFEALVSCIIMICFHGIRRSRASFMLLRCGLKLLEECRSNCMTYEEQRTVDEQLRPLFNRLLSSPCRVGNIGEALKISIQRHRAQNQSIIIDTPLVPTSFSDLADARQTLQRIFNWAHDHVPLASGLNLYPQQIWTTLRCLKCAWESALHQSDLPKAASSNRSRMVLEAACIVNMVIIESLEYQDERSFDDHEEVFKQAIERFEHAKSSQHTADFGIDSGLIDLIAFVGTKCRDPQLRRRALHLLKHSGRIEGDRIASNPATILDALVALEERDLVVDSCHDIPESSRRRLVCGQQYITQRRIDLFYETADGSCKERCSVSLAAPRMERTGIKCNAEADIPDVIFGPGYAAYLEDRQSRSYFRLDMERFYFPIPKV